MAEDNEFMDLSSVKTILKKAIDINASDVYIIAGSLLTYKVDGKMKRYSTRMLSDDTLRLIDELYNFAKRDMNQQIDDDFAVAIPDVGRFRVNVFRQRASLNAVVRVCSFNNLNFDGLGIPLSVMKSAELQSGLVLVTGAAGSGKSTTVASIIDRINRTRDCHILTLEDPLEYLHRHNHSIVSQREMGIDFFNYQDALRAATREAPDVIMIGEMRDFETIEIALTAAETGRLVISTLHTMGAASTIDRIIDVFPASQQRQIRIQLSTVLRMIVSQQLVPTNSGRILASEVLLVNQAVRTLIRDSKTHQIESLMFQSQDQGMQTMDLDLFRLYKDGIIDENAALSYCYNKEGLEKRIEADKRKNSLNQ